MSRHAGERRGDFRPVLVVVHVVGIGLGIADDLSRGQHHGDSRAGRAAEFLAESVHSIRLPARQEFFDRLAGQACAGLQVFVEMVAIEPAAPRPIRTGRRSGARRRAPTSRRGRAATTSRFLEHRLFLEAVAHAADRFDVVARGAEFAAQADDLHVHRPVGGGVVVAVDAVEDLLAGEDPARPLGEEPEQLELGGGQIDRLAAHRDLVPAGMDHQVADFDDLAFFVVLFVFFRCPRWPADARRSTACTRAKSTLGLNGLVT